MRSSVRVVLFLVSLAVLIATATPVRAHEGHPAHEPGDLHAGHDHDAGGPDKASTAELAEIADSDPALRARRVDAHLIEEWHRDHGHRRWGRGTGHWGHSWSTFRVQARQLRAYLLSQSESVRRFALVWHWSAVADCESSGNWSIDTGNGYLGGLQFTIGTWRAYGGQGLPHHQPAWYQAEIADNVRTRSGLHHWPVCGRLYR